MGAQTPVCDFGRRAPEFSLPGIDGQTYSLDSVKGENGTLVMFICNHCPYVKAVIDRLVETARTLEGHGISTVAVMSNDWDTYSEDAPEKCVEFARAHGFTFPYLLDADQSVARAYDAVCTPDFFGFNANLELQYRGRLDASRSEKTEGLRNELLEAMIGVARTGQGPLEQTPSIGCSIKWRS